MIQYFTTFIMVDFQQQRRKYVFCLFTLLTMNCWLVCIMLIHIQVYDAARRAAIHDAILNFPERYSTVVGERGLKVIRLVEIMLYDLLRFFL